MFLFFFILALIPSLVEAQEHASYQIITNNSKIGIRIQNTVSENGDSSFDWSQLPDIGLPKSEIHTIEILQRSILYKDDGTVSFPPDRWKFIGDTWSLEYSGTIPYLQNIDFPNLDPKFQIEYSAQFEQNRQGFLQDKKTGIPGFYPFINSQINDSTVSFFQIQSIKQVQTIETIAEETKIQQVDKDAKMPYTPNIKTNKSVSEQDITRPSTPQSTIRGARRSTF